MVPTMSPASVMPVMAVLAFVTANVEYAPAALRRKPVCAPVADCWKPTMAPDEFTPVGIVLAAPGASMSTVVPSVLRKKPRLVAPLV